MTSHILQALLTLSSNETHQAMHLRHHVEIQEYTSLYFFFFFLNFRQPSFLPAFVATCLGISDSFFKHLRLYSTFSVVVQPLSWVWLCDLMDCSTPGSSVLHYLLEFAQIHVHWVGGAIYPSHPLLPPCPFAFSLFLMKSPYVNDGNFWVDYLPNIFNTMYSQALC